MPCLAAFADLSLEVLGPTCSSAGVHHRCATSLLAGFVDPASIAPGSLQNPCGWRSTARAEAMPSVATLDTSLPSQRRSTRSAFTHAEDSGTSANTTKKDDIPKEYKVHGKPPFSEACATGGSIPKDATGCYEGGDAGLHGQPPYTEPCTAGLSGAHDKPPEGAAGCYDPEVGPPPPPSEEDMDPIEMAYPEDLQQASLGMLQKHIEPSIKLPPELRGAAAAVERAGSLMQAWVVRRQRLAEELPKFGASIKHCNQEANFAGTKEAAEDIKETEIEDEEMRKGELSEVEGEQMVTDAEEAAATTAISHAGHAHQVNSPISALQTDITDSIPMARRHHYFSTGYGGPDFSIVDAALLQARVMRQRSAFLSAAVQPELQLSVPMRGLKHTGTSSACSSFTGDSAGQMVAPGDSAGQMVAPGDSVGQVVATGDSAGQDAAHVAPCDVDDGSGSSSTYPCGCGTATCGPSQKCNVGSNSCEGDPTNAAGAAEGEGGNDKEEIDCNEFRVPASIQVARRAASEAYWAFDKALNVAERKVTAALDSAIVRGA